MLTHVTMCPPDYASSLAGHSHQSTSGGGQPLPLAGLTVWLPQTACNTEVSAILLAEDCKRHSAM
jgi:hypothetical protein